MAFADTSLLHQLEIRPLHDALDAEALGLDSRSRCPTMTSREIAELVAKDTANFLAALGEIRKGDIPESFGPAINASYALKALAK